MTGVVNNFFPVFLNLFDSSHSFLFFLFWLKRLASYIEMIITSKSNMYTHPSVHLLLIVFFKIHL